MNSFQPSDPLYPGRTGLIEVVLGSGLVFLGTATKGILVFATELLVARILLPERYGLITWGLLLINILATLGGLGLHTAVRRYLPLYLAQGDSGSVRGTVLMGSLLSASGGCLAGILLFVGAGWLASSVLGDQRETAILLTLVFALPMLTIQRNMIGVFAGFKLPRYKVLVEDILVPWGYFTVVLLAWAMEWKEIAICRGYVLVLVVSTVWSVLIAQRKTPYWEIRKVNPKIQVREILGFSWPLIFTEGLIKTTGIIDIFLIGAFSAAYDVGIYRTASNLAMIMYFTLSCFGFLYLPVISEYIGKGDSSQWKDMNARIARWSMLINFPIFATLFFFPSEVLHFAYGPNYSAAATVLRILAVAYFAHAMVGFTGGNLVAAGYTRAQLMAHLVGFGINIGGNCLLIPIYGVHGAAVTTLISICVVNVILLRLVWAHLMLHPFTTLYLKALGVLLLFGTVGSSLLRATHFLPPSGVVVVFPLACFGFILLLFWWGYFIDATDQSLIRSLVKAQLLRLRGAE